MSARNNPVLLTGPTRGLDGRGWISKARDPIISDGRIGDMWFNTLTHYGFGPKTAGGWGAGTYLRGPHGWTALTRVVIDGTRRVREIYDWIGGEGTKPATGYEGATGTVPDIEDAVDYRGAEGPEMLVSGLADASAAITDATLLPTAEAGEDNERRSAVEVFDLGGVLDRRDVGHAQASTVRKVISTIRLPGSFFQRAPSEPAVTADRKFRTLDRWTDEGNHDSANGGWWILVDIFARIPAALNEFIGTLKAPYVLPAYRGLKMQEFLTANDAWSTSKTSALQAAVTALFSDDRYQGLDLEGRLLTVGAPITFGNQAKIFPDKYITNGHVYAREDFPIGQYLFDLSGMPDIRNFDFRGVQFNGAGRAGWVRMPYKYKSFRFWGCRFNNPRGGGDLAAGVPEGRYVGIYDPDKPAGGSHELQIIGGYWDAGQYTTPSSARNIIGLFSNNPDIQLAYNIGQYFETWFYGRSGAYQINGNHVWSTSDGIVANKMIWIPGAVRGIGAIVEGNYIDGLEIRLSNLMEPNRRIGGVSVNGNFLLAPPDLPANFAFVVLEPHAVNTGLTGITMDGNAYDNNGSVVFKNIDVDSGFGSINGDDIQRVLLNDAGADVSISGRVYRSAARYNHKATSENTKNFDFSASIPPFAKIKRSAASFERAHGGAPMAYAVPRVTGEKTVTVDLSAASTGRIELVVDINSDDFAP